MNAKPRIHLSQDEDKIMIYFSQRLLAICDKFGKHIGITPAAFKVFERIFSTKEVLAACGYDICQFSGYESPPFCLNGEWWKNVYWTADYPLPTCWQNCLYYVGPVYLGGSC